MTTSSVNAFFFPGASVEPCGREASFYECNKNVMAPLVDKASTACDRDLADALLNDHLAELTEKENHFFTYAYSCGVAQVHANAGIAPACAAGYSLGVYAALASVDALSYDDGLLMVGTAYDILARYSGVNRYGAGVTVGLSLAETGSLLCTGNFPSVKMVNVNNETCMVYSGLKTEMIAFLESAQQAGALSTVLLPTHIPYHHPELLGGVMQPFAEVLDKIEWRNAMVPLVSALDQRFLVKAADLREYTKQNLYSPVNWMSVVAAVAQSGVNCAYECGPGITLSRNGRFLTNNIRYVTVKNAEGNIRSCL